MFNVVATSHIRRVPTGRGGQEAYFKSIHTTTFPIISADKLCDYSNEIEIVTSFGSWVYPGESLSVVCPSICTMSTSKYLGDILLIWTPALPNGVHSNRPCLSVSPLVSLKISQGLVLSFFYFCMKFGVNKVGKVTQMEFWERFLIWGLSDIECLQFMFLDIFLENSH